MNRNLDILTRKLRRAIEKHDHIAELLLRQRIAALA